ncbi:MAG TPA: permease [Devosiaceae bacterium]
MSSPTVSLWWFARHEMRLNWRDWMGMMLGGRRRRTAFVVLGLVAVAAMLHLIASVMVGPWLRAGVVPDKHTLVMLTGGGLLFWAVMLSQALESVTRGYYGRADLDLILASPAPATKLFAIRTGAIALSTTTLSALLAAPAIDMLAWYGGAQWLAGYGVLLALGAAATGISVLVTLGLFRLFGARRTRLVSQILAAVIGAGFVIGIQAAAILGYGRLSRASILSSDSLANAAPDPSSILYLPARAFMGDPMALLSVMVAGFGLLAVVIAATSNGFARLAIAATGVGEHDRGKTSVLKRFMPGSQRAAMRRKEWRLLRRDPWLISQTLMQVFYLVPPALLLWRNFGADASAYVIVVPVIVMATGQLAGGLAWLAVSGEDAPDLVAIAPLPPRAILTAKIEAILGAVAIVVLPLVAILAVLSPGMAAITFGGAVISAISATAIQIWHRVKARRAMFRRRQVASRTATLSEAFSSILWAGAAAVAAANLWIFAVITGVLALGVLGIARLLAPRRTA